MTPPPRRLSILPSTVTVLGFSWARGRNAGWSGLRLHEGRLVDDGVLSVPFCHPDDPSHGEDDSMYRLRPKDEGYRFVLARNGAWVLEADPP
jgi:hypothetical protein